VGCRLAIEIEFALTHPCGMSAQTQDRATPSAGKKP
jgi:hypothetical protein